MEDVLPAAQPRDAAQQPEAGHAARHRRGDRQPDRHRLRLRARHRPGALLLHARRAARAAPHARGADHPAAPRQERHADGDPSEAVPLLRARRVARRHAAHRRRGARARRQREARLPRALPAARDQADRARRRHGRHPREARAGRAGGAQAARQLHPRRGRPDARRRGPRGAGEPPGSLAVVETFTSGQIAARIAPSAGRRAGLPPRHRGARPRRGRARRSASTARPRRAS